MNRIALANPALLFLLLLLLIILYNVIPESAPPTVHTSVGISATLYVMLWPFSVFRYLTDLNPQAAAGDGGSFNLPIVGVHLGIFLSLLFGGPRELFQSDSPGMVIADIIAFVLSISWFYIYGRLSWLAAKHLIALEGYEEASPSQIFGTFLLLLYWPLGVFFLHGRLIKARRRQQKGVMA